MARNDTASEVEEGGVMTDTRKGGQREGVGEDESSGCVRAKPLHAQATLLSLFQNTPLLLHRIPPFPQQSRSYRSRSPVSVEVR